MEETFFAENTRRECILVGASTLNRDEEKRVKLSLRIPLSGQSLLGMPDWLGDAHDAVARTVTSATLDVSYKGMNINIFATDQSPERELQIAAAALGKFNVARSGSGENPDVDLHFVAIAPFNTRFWKWAGDMTGYHFFAKFEAAQRELTVDKPTADGKAAAANDDQPSLLVAEEEDLTGPEHDEEFASTTPKKGQRPPKSKLDPAGRKRIADAMKRRLTAAVKGK